MNKWDNSFDKKPNNTCYCSTHTGLFVPNRQLSWIVASLLLIIFCSFISGYFLGKKSAIEQFSEKMHQDLVSDTVYTSLAVASDVVQEHDKERIEEKELDSIQETHAHQEVIATTPLEKEVIVFSQQ